ncbi:AraC family transcriptional regulator [Aquimarina algicola]
MVCPRCITAVEHIFKKLNIHYSSVKLGEVLVETSLDKIQIQELKTELEEIGFALIDDRKSHLIAQMKNLVIAKIHHSDKVLEVNWATYISEKLHLDYKYLSSLFSSEENITFEHYIIHQKIERCKELITYDELNLSEIAFKLNYSSVAYLSTQFKKVTNMTPSQFKKSKYKNRKPLDEF